MTWECNYFLKGFCRRLKKACTPTSPGCVIPKKYVLLSDLESQSERTTVKRRRKKNAFTMIELIVVITIIILVAAMLLPAVQKSREKSREAVCLNNLKQIGVAITLYTQDWSGFTPAVFDASQDRGVIYVRVNNYLKNPAVFWCPSSGTERKWDGLDGPVDDKGVSYGFNFVGTGRYHQHPDNSGFCSYAETFPGSYRNTREMFALDQTIVAADSFQDLWQEFQIGYTEFNWTIGSPGSIHHGGSNVLFADGHVSWHSLTYLRNTRHHWNFDNSDKDYNPDGICNIGGCAFTAPH